MSRSCLNQPVTRTAVAVPRRPWPAPSRTACRQQDGSRALRSARLAQRSFGGQRLPRPDSMRRSSPHAVICAAAGGGWQQVDVEQGKVLLDRQGHKFLDLRTEREFDNERLTKPPRCSINVPIMCADANGAMAANPNFIAQLSAAVPKSTKLLVATQNGGPWSTYAMEMIVVQGYEALEVVGGYEAWTQVFSTSGRRRPPAGRWVSTGTEALKSGLNVGDAAASYTEGGDLQSARWANSNKNQSPWRQ
eukprot:jgi/Tetstr1/461938/TSEL_007016.t1